MRTHLTRFALATAAAMAALAPLSAGAVTDSTAPVVATPTPTSLYKNAPTVISATFTDDIAGVTACALYVGGVSQGAMTITTSNGGLSGSASRTYTYTGSATFINVAVWCTDQAAVPNTGISPTRSMSVLTDATPPSVTNLQPGTATVGVATTMSANFSDAGSGVVKCWYSDNALAPFEATIGGGLATYSRTFPSAGVYNVFMECEDAAGNNNSANRTVTVSAADVTAPSVTNVQPLTATVGVPTTISVTATDANGVVGCGAEVNGAPAGAGGGSGAMTLSGPSFYSISHTFTMPGINEVDVQCWDASGNEGRGLVNTSVTASSDAVAPSVTNIQPGSGVAGVGFTVTANYSDAVGVTVCEAFLSGGEIGTMTLSGGAGSVSGTASMPMSYHAYGPFTATLTVQCRDAAGNQTVATRSFTSTGADLFDAVVPTVTNLQPGTATAGVATPITFTYGDDVGIGVCHLQVNGVQDDVDPTLSGGVGSSSGTASRTRTFAAAGTYTILVFCEDHIGNESAALSRSLVVSAAAPGADVTLPTVGQITQTAATAGTAITLTATASDNVGISACTLYVAGASQGTMSVSGGSASRSHTFASAGTYAVEVRCTDAAGNIGIGTSRSITVGAAGTTPAPSPSPSPTPISTGRDTDTDGDDLSDADEAVYGTSPTDSDSDNDGFSDGVEVRGGYNPLGAGRLTPPTTSAVPGRLIKLACPSGADGFHACRAVYYYGRDGKRHPFPSARIYFTWFSDFSQIQVVDAAFMASLPIGKNVLPRPGVRLIKFATVNTVYAVNRGGVLQAIANETVAAGIYGSGWNAKIDDVDDTLFGNFLFGTDLTSAGSFSPAAATSGTTSIDGNF